MAVTTPSAGQYADYDLAHVSELGEAAQACITVAAFIVPTAWPIAEFVYQHQCDPGQLVKTGLTWLSMTGTLDDSQLAVRTTTSGVDHDTWHGKDRGAFDKHTDEYVLQLIADGLVSGATGAVLVVVGVLLAILMLAMFVVSVVLLTFAILIEALADSVALSAAAVDVEAMASEFAAEAGEALETMDKAVKAVSDTGGGLLTTSLAANAAGQLATGNKDTVHNLIQTMVYGNLDAAAGLLSLGEQEATGRGIKNKSVNALLYGAYQTGSQSEGVDDTGRKLTGKQAWDEGGSAWNDVLPGTS